MRMSYSPREKNFPKKHFLVAPRDFLTQTILLKPATVKALHRAAEALRIHSNGRYILVLTRGYVYWGKWRQFLEKIAKIIFSSLYWSDRAASDSLFGHNGHHDGYSVDVLPYDCILQKKVQWLSWKNIMISRIQAQTIIEIHQETIQLIDKAMKSANFTCHSDPREQLQMHYRLNIENDDLAKLIKLSKNI